MHMLCKNKYFQNQMCFFHVFQSSHQMLTFPENLQVWDACTLLWFLHMSIFCVNISFFLYDMCPSLSFPDCFCSLPFTDILHLPLSFAGLSEACSFKFWIHHQYLWSVLCICHSFLTPSLPLSVFPGTLIFPASLPGHYHCQISHSLLIFIF